MQIAGELLQLTFRITIYYVNYLIIYKYFKFKIQGLLITGIILLVSSQIRTIDC